MIQEHEENLGNLIDLLNNKHSETIKTHKMYLNKTVPGCKKEILKDNCETIFNKVPTISFSSFYHFT